jgi:iron(III) transport system permease protein
MATRSIAVRTGRRWGLGGRDAIVLFGALVLLGTVVILLVTLGLSVQAENGSLTLANFQAVFADPFVYRALANTVGFAAVSVVTALCFGLPIAWIAERTDLPGRGAIYPLMTAGLLVPGFFNAMGWLLLFHPRMGMINVWLTEYGHFPPGTLNVVSIPGMGIVQGLGLATLMFIMCGAAFRAMDAALEESAQIHGLSLIQRTLTVTLPLLWPSILAAIIYVFMVGLAVFDVPAIIGLANRIYTYSTFVYSITNPSTAGTPNYGVAGASSAIVVALALLLAACYFRTIRRSNRYAVVSGKGYRPKPLRLGRRAIACWGFIGLYILLSIGLPGCVLLWASLLPYFMPLSIAALAHVTVANYLHIPWGGFWRAAANSATIMIVAPTITAAAALAISWVVTRSGLRAVSRVFEVLAFLPLAIPSVVFAVGAMVFAIFVLPSWFPFYGTVAIIITVQVVVQISFATRVLNGALLQIHRDLDDAGSTFGLGSLAVVWHILGPLLAPALVSTWLWMALLSYRELTIAMMLVTDKNLTLPVFVFGIFSQGNIGESAAATILLGCCIVPLIVAYFAVMRKGLSFQ